MPRALIIDDEPAILEVISIFVQEKSDYEVLVSYSAEDALELLSKQPIDVIICDYQMSGMDGIALLKQLRSKGSNIPFILFTGKGREEVVIEALNSGADFYLQKGGDIKSMFAELVHLMDQAISKRKTMEALEHNARRFRSLIENSSDLIITIDADAKVNFVSPSIKRLLDYEPEKFAGTPFTQYIYEKDLENFCAQLNQLLSGMKSAVRFEMKMKHNDGAYRVFEFEMMVDRYAPSGKGIIMNGRDITERKSLKHEITSTRKLMEALLNNLAELVVYQDTENRIIWANKAAADSVGMRLKDVIGKHCYEVWNNRESPCENCPIVKSIQTGSPHSAEMRTYDGRWWLISGAPMMDDRGKIIGVIESALDVTDYKIALSLLEKNEARYQTIMENLPVGIYIFQDGKLRFVNEMLCRLSGYSREELLAANYLDLVHPDYKEELEKLTDLLLANPKRYNPEPYEFAYIAKNGSVRWARLSPAIIDYEGRPAILGSVIDTTDFKKMEELSKKNEELYRSIFENTGTASVVIEEDTRISMANREAEKLTGYKIEEIAGRSFLEFIAPEDRDRLKEYHRLRRSQENAVPNEFEFRLVTKNGDIRECKAVVSMIPRTKRSLASIIDFTELKRAHDELRQMAQEQNMLLDNIDTMVWYAIDPETYGLVNEARAKFLGLKKEELIGRKLRDVLPKGTCEVCIEGNQKAFRGERILQEEWLITTDGNAQCVLVNKVPMFDESGKVKRVFCTATDITHIKNMEKALQLANLKVNLLYRMTRHDISNQLMVITGYLDLMKNAQNKMPLEQIISKLESAVKNILEHLEFTKEMEELGKELPCWMKLLDPINKAISQLDLTGISLIIDEKAGSIHIFSDKMIWKVFYNLIHNTLKHARSAKNIRIFTEMKGKELQIIYEDDGPGIEKKRGVNIFDSPLVRNRAKGLYLVKEIIEMNEMKIEEVGEKGVKFVISVPTHRFKIE
ncbi:MAG: PAS domain S-box protein [Methanomassiliicoccales archaeon]